MNRHWISCTLLGIWVSSFWLTTVACSDGLPAGREAHWHRFRGPEGTGVAPRGNPPTTWDEQTNVKWKVPIPGRGSASPIVWGDRIFVLTAIKTDRTSLAPEDSTASSHRTQARFVSQIEEKPEYQLAQQTPPQQELRDRSQDQQNRGREGRGRQGGRRGRLGFGRGEPPTNVHEFKVICIDRGTGDIIWQRTACEAIPHENHHRTGSFASASPVTDGKNLYVSFGSRGIYSYDLDGNFRWKRNLGRMRTRFSFGEGASPALYGDTLVVNWDQEDQSFITALDANTGETRWKVDRDEATTWTTPLIVEHSGHTQVIVNGTNRVRSYDLKNGELIWECGGQAQGVVPTPVVHGDLVLTMTGHRGSALYAIPLDSVGDITDSDKVVWTRHEGTPYVPSPLLYGDRFFFTKSNNAILTCVSPETGDVFFENERLNGLEHIYASHVGAANRVYISGRNGTTLILKNGPELEVLAMNSIAETIDATPAIVDNQIIIRGENHLFCIAEN